MTLLTNISSGVRRRFCRARRRRIALSLAGKCGEPHEKALACVAGADFSCQDFLRDDLRSAGVESLGSAQEAVCCPSMFGSALCVSHAHAHMRVCMCVSRLCMCVRGVVWTSIPVPCVYVTNGTCWQVGARTREYLGGRFRAPAGGSPRMSGVCLHTRYIPVSFFSVEESVAAPCGRATRACAHALVPDTIVHTISLVAVVCEWSRVLEKKNAGLRSHVCAHRGIETGAPCHSSCCAVALTPPACSGTPANSLPC